MKHDNEVEPSSASYEWEKFISTGMSYPKEALSILNYQVQVWQLILRLYAL